MLCRIEKRKCGPTGALVDMGTHQLHAVVKGEEGPAVIFESGLGGCSLDWCLVQPEAARFSRAVAYDRAGYGWSVGTKQDYTVKAHAQELKVLLDKLQVKPPYILAGHSYGGFIIRMFAALYPKEVIGLVLVDSVHEDQYLSGKMSDQRWRERSKVMLEMQLGYLFAPTGLPRFLKKRVGLKRLPEGHRDAGKALGSQTKAYTALYSEYRGTVYSAEQARQFASWLGDLPVRVISAGRQSKQWKENQLKLLGLSSHSKQVVAEDSWHSVPIDAPHLIVECIKEIADRYRFLISKNSHCERE